MNQKFTIIAIIYITTLSVNAQPGDPVPCGTPGAGTSTDCQGCGNPSHFQTDNSPNCKVNDCFFSNSFADYNGWMCKSCSNVGGLAGGYPVFQTNACVSSCSSGYVADASYTCQPITGSNVACGTSGATTSTDCSGCGNLAQKALFTQSATPNCKVTDCTKDPSTNLNGWMCKSCAQSTVAHPAYGIGKSLLQGTTCVAACSPGYAADANQICQPVFGNNVACGTSGVTTSTDCNGCGNAAQKALFMQSATPNCKVTDCTKDPSTNLNGWMCKSCTGTTGAHAAYGTGKPLLQGTTCVASCSPGYAADANQICQPLFGSDVACGTSGATTSTDCNGCGNAAQKALFTPSATPNCKITDCTQDPSTNLNGWMCKSCTGTTGAHAAYGTGKPLLQGTVCVASCNTGYSPDANQICQPNSIAGIDVNCGTAGTAGGNATNCNSCGANSTIQNLFAPSATPNCKVIDCSANPSANLNGWMCKSCSGVSGAHTAYSAGKFFSSNACVASCSKGQTADSNNVCQASSSSTLQALALSILLLCLLY